MPFPSDDQIRSVFGSADPRLLAAFEDRGRDALQRAEILDSDDRLAYFLAQCLAEVGPTAVLEESLVHTKAARIREVWSTRFRTVADAEPYVRNPQGLANLVYGGRLGNDQPGDGWRYRGRGLIQITGRANYRAVGDAIGLPLESDPDLAADPDNVWDVAAGYWAVNRLNRFADKGDFDGLTRAINGSNRTVQERRETLKRVRTALGTAAPTRGPSRPDHHFEPEIQESAVSSIGPQSSRPQVESIQKALKERNYPVGKVDGIYGNITAGAVLIFQNDNGLEPTGIVDAATHRALFNAGERPVPPSRRDDGFGELRDLGSRTIANLDRAKLTAAILAILSLFGIGKEVVAGPQLGSLPAAPTGIPAAAAELYAQACTAAAGPASALCKELLKNYTTIETAARQVVPGDPTNVLDPLLSAVGGLAQAVLPGAGGGVAGLVLAGLGWIFSQRAQNARLDDHRKGRHLG